MHVRVCVCVRGEKRDYYSVKPCRHELKGSACTLLLQGADLGLFAVDEYFELVRKTETEEDKRSESTETEQSMMYAIKNREVKQHAG